MDELIRLSKKLALEEDFHSPTVIVEGTEQRGVLFPTNGATPEGREREMFLAGRSLSRERAIGELKLVCLVTGGWMASSHNGKFIQPSKDPERIEVLVFNGLDVDQNKQTFVVFKMVRNPEGKLTDLWEFTMPKGVEGHSYLLPAFMAGYKSTSGTC